MIKFTANYDDLSTDRGYQFKFHCDKCGNGYMSRFQPSLTGTAGGLLRAAGDLFGGVFSSAGNSAYEIQRATGGKAHDSALEKAVEEAKGYFKQCTRCGKWVCPEVCWNAKAGLCEECAPDFEEDFSASRAQAMSNAARERAARLAILPVVRREDHRQQVLPGMRQPDQSQVDLSRLRPPAGRLAKVLPGMRRENAIALGVRGQGSGVGATRQSRAANLCHPAPDP
jgi:hypothetical protein